MPAILTSLFSLADSLGTRMTLLSDLLVRSYSGRTFLYAASSAENALSAFEILPDGSASWLFNKDAGTATAMNSLSDLHLFGFDDKQYLSFSAHRASAAATCIVRPDGGLGGLRLSGSGIAAYSNFSNQDGIATTAGTFVYASRWDEPGLQWFQLTSAGRLVRKGGYADTSRDYLRDIADLETASFSSRKFLFTASGIEPGIQSYSIGQSGALTLIDRSGPQEQWGFGALSVLEFVRLGGKGFLVAGSAGSGSLIVYSVDAAGKIAPVDQLLDTGQTRFDGIQALTGFTKAGRAFLLAGGADDGLTLLQLGAYGKLSVLSVLEDDWDTTLGNVSAIEVVRYGSAIKVIVGGSAEGGFTIFSLDLGNLGKVLKGTIGADALAGTGADDDLYGNDGNDRLNGGAGDDRIADGRGADKLTGGTGADIFDFADDGKTDTILDFETGIDRIDLSAFPLLYDVSEVAITAQDYGYDIRIGDDLMVLRTAGGSPGGTYVFGPDDFIFG